MARILFLSSHHGIGAAENLWLETAAHLARTGHDVRAAVCWLKWEPARVQELVSLGVPVVRIAQSWTFNRWLRPLLRGGKAEARMTAQLAGGSWKPDHVLVSQGNDHSCLPWLKALQDMGISTSVVTHGIISSDWPKDGLADQLRPVFTRAARTFWVSERNQTDFEDQIGAALPNALVVRNPVKVDRSAPFTWPAGGSPLRMACVARMQTRPKGHDLLLQAFADPVWNQRDLHLSFFGDGENRRGMERLAQKLGIAARVHFKGHVNSVEDIWRDHHLIAQPSRNEGMPLSLVEALFCGRPALATDIAGHAELITEGENGFIAEAATARHIGEALERAWNQRDQWQSMGRAAYDRIRRDVPENPAADFARQILELT